MKSNLPQVLQFVKPDAFKIHACCSILRVSLTLTSQPTGCSQVTCPQGRRNVVPFISLTNSFMSQK